MESNLVYGRRAVEQILECAADRVIELFVLRDSKSSFVHPKITEVEDTEQLYELTKSRHHQGVVARVKPQAPVSLEQLIQKSLSAEGKRLILVLDQVADPQNLGSILRVAETAGVDGVVLTKDNSSPLTPAARKVSVGASELLSLVRVKNLRSSLEALKKEGFWIIGAALDEQAVPHYQASLSENIAIVLGAEGKGLRELTKKTCDILVEIPMQGAIDSLNVAQASAVLLFEAVRQRSQG